MFVTYGYSAISVKSVEYYYSDKAVLMGCCKWLGHHNCLLLSLALIYLRFRCLLSPIHRLFIVSTCMQWAVVTLSGTSLYVLSWFVELSPFFAWQRCRKIQFQELWIICVRPQFLIHISNSPNTFYIQYEGHFIWHNCQIIINMFH